MAASQVEILFHLDPEDWHGHGTETLWADHVEGSGWTRFRIRNSPFFVMDVSFADIVRASPRDDGFIFAFDRVTERGGHSTYMLLVDDETRLARGDWRILEKMGCSYESMYIDLTIGRKLLLSVDVPADADIIEAHRLIADGETSGAWLYQTGYSTFVDGSLPIRRSGYLE
jgi:hypothetical protein